MYTPANLAQQYGGQKLGIYGEPMEDPGKPFGSQPFQQYYPGSSMAFDQARQEIFSQDSDILGMRSMGLLQGDSGYGGAQQGFGFGGYDFNTIFENRFKQFAPAA